MYEKTLSTETIYSGRVLGLDVLEIEMENGVRSTREIIRHRHAVAILAELPDGRFVFVKQFRKAIEQDIVEVVAGLIENGETPEECARREIVEETGYEIDQLVPLGDMYPSPGYTEEKIYGFWARLRPKKGATDFDHDEHLDLLLMTGDEFLARLERGEVQDSKTLALWLLAEKKLKGNPL